MGNLLRNLQAPTTVPYAALKTKQKCLALHMDCSWTRMWLHVGFRQTLGIKPRTFQLRIKNDTNLLLSPCPFSLKSCILVAEPKLQRILREGEYLRIIIYYNSGLFHVETMAGPLHSRAANELHFPGVSISGSSGYLAVERV